MNATSNASTSPKGNLIVILCDQLRRDALGCYGDPNIETPHIDALAERGVRFNHMCSTYPICVPFRFSMMTGQYAHTRMIPGIGWRMSPAERTLADEFNAADIQTLYVGKWHLHGGYIGMKGYGAFHENLKPVPRLFQGRWKHWRGFELRNEPFDTHYFVDDDPTPRPIPGYQTDGLFDIAMDDLRKFKAKDQRFACVVSVEPPHPPFVAPEAFEARWADRDIKLPANFDDKGDPAYRQRLLKERRTYYAMVENIDENVGRLTRFLDEQQLTENTTIVFLADHGELGGSHGDREKQQPYEESVGVPLIVAGPGVTRNESSGGVIHEPLATEDLFPTFLGLMGLTARDATPGMDASGLMDGQETKLDRSGVMLQFVRETRPQMKYYDATWRAWRSERYKYIVQGDLTGALPYQLFDLQKDPGEMRNLIDDPAHQDIAAGHHRALCERLIETVDDYALAPAFGCEALNVYPANRGTPE